VPSPNVLNGSACSVAGLLRRSDRIPRPQRVLTRLVGDGHGVLNVGLRHVAERHRKGAGSPRDTNARQAPRAGSVSMWRADGSSRRTISG
jgi:hypothetical protein